MYEVAKWLTKEVHCSELIVDYERMEIDALEINS